MQGTPTESKQMQRSTIEYRKMKQLRILKDEVVLEQEYWRKQIPDTLDERIKKIKKEAYLKGKNEAYSETLKVLRKGIN